MSCFSKSLSSFVTLLSEEHENGLERVARFSNKLGGAWEAIQKSPLNQISYRKASALPQIAVKITTELAETTLKHRNHIDVIPGSALPRGLCTASDFLSMLEDIQ